MFYKILKKTSFFIHHLKYSETRQTAVLRVTSVVFATGMHHCYQGHSRRAGEDLTWRGQVPGTRHPGASSPQGEQIFSVKYRFWTPTQNGWNQI